jgi:hypothetical protein
MNELTDGSGDGASLFMGTLLGNVELGSLTAKFDGSFDMHIWVLAFWAQRML